MKRLARGEGLVIGTSEEDCSGGWDSKGRSMEHVPEIARQVS